MLAFWPSTDSSRRVHQVTHSDLCFITSISRYAVSEISHTRISNIVRSYDCLTESISEINKCFSGSVAVIVFSCYLHLVTCPYELFVILTSNESNALNFVSFIWVVLHACRLFVIVETCNKCQQEVSFLATKCPQITAVS
jgi:hypothetical protein